MRFYLYSTHFQTWAKQHRISEILQAYVHMMLFRENTAVGCRAQSPSLRGNRSDFLHSLPLPSLESKLCHLLSWCHTVVTLITPGKIVLSSQVDNDFVCSCCVNICSTCCVHQKPFRVVLSCSSISFSSEEHKQLSKIDGFFWSMYN